MGKCNTLVKKSEKNSNYKSFTKLPKIDEKKNHKLRE